MDGCHSQANDAGWALSLVIPAYNEEAGILQAIVEADEALSTLTSHYEVLVVDDGSRDNTSRVVEDAARTRPNVKLLRHEVNKGYGAALRTGFDAARYNRVAFTDADCQFHLLDLAPLLELTKDYDLAVGFRVGRKDPAQRRFYSWGYNVLIRALMGTRVRDCDCALKVFRKEALLRILPETSGFFINTEMLTRARQLGMSIAQTGVRHRPRLRGSSKVSLLDIPRTLSALLPFWWTRILFAGSGPAARPNKFKWSTAAGFGLLMLAAGLLLFTRLSNPLQEPQEARYAEIPRQMLAADSWIVPILHGEPYRDKPPLLYWLVMGSYRLFGVHDWAARLVPCSAMFLCVLLTYAWGRRVVGHQAALAGAGILCLSARFIFLGRFLTMDAVLCLFVLAALAFAHLAISQGGERARGRRLIHGSYWLLSALACGLGLLTKGPVILVLVLAPVLLCQLVDRRCAGPRWSNWIAYLSIAVGIAAPWYVAMSVRQPDFIAEFFWKHNVERFVSPFDHQEPFWYFIPSLLLGMLPWTLLLPGLVGFLFHRSLRTGMRRPGALGFFLTAAVWGLLFFSVSGCKRATYILPVMPPLALALGYYLAIGQPGAELLRLSKAFLARGYGLAQQATLIVLILGFVATLFAYKESFIRLPQTLGAMGFLAGLCGIVYWRARLLPSFRAWRLCAVVTFGMLFLAVNQLSPPYARKYSLRNQIRRVQVHTQSETIRVASYPKAWESISFYLPDVPLTIYSLDRNESLIADLKKNGDTVLFVKSGKTLEDLQHSLPAEMVFQFQGTQAGVVVGRLRAPGKAFMQYVTRKD
jgi:4-amino-4-deoxy-L-arabinose transferase-like glycosyltransferase